MRPSRPACLRHAGTQQPGKALPERGFTYFKAEAGRIPGWETNKSMDLHSQPSLPDHRDAMYRKMTCRKEPRR